MSPSPGSPALLVPHLFFFLSPSKSPLPPHLRSTDSIMASTSNVGDVEPAADPVVSVPGAEIADPRRQALIDQLDSLLSSGTGNYRLRQDMWACLWLCSVEILESIVRTAPSSTEMLNMVDSLFAGNYYEIHENVVKPCMYSFQLPHRNRLGFGY